MAQLISGTTDVREIHVGKLHIWHVVGVAHYLLPLRTDGTITKLSIYLNT